MTLLPVVQRKLSEAARRKGTYRTRVLAVAAALALGAWIYAEQSRWQLPARRGGSLFQGIAGLMFGFSLLSGVYFTSDCLSKEKRDGTLGLLFLTDLKGYDVGLGKLLATSLNAIYGLIATFPILAIPLLVGGITWADFARMTLVLANTLFVSLAIGIAVSTVSRNERNAAVATFLLLLFLAGGLPLMGQLHSEIAGTRSVPNAYLLPSPGFGFSVSLTYGFSRLSNLFWRSPLTTHLIGWTFLFVSCLLLPRIWQDRPRPANGSNGMFSSSDSATVAL